MFDGFERFRIFTRDNEPGRTTGHDILCDRRTADHACPFLQMRFGAQDRRFERLRIQTFGDVYENGFFREQGTEHFYDGWDGPGRKNHEYDLRVFDCGGQICGRGNIRSEFEIREIVRVAMRLIDCVHDFFVAVEQTNRMSVAFEMFRDRGAHESGA